MKKLGFKALSFVISFLMVFYMIPMSVYAEMFDNIGTSENDGVENSDSSQRVHDVFEAADRREETVKHFRLEDGSYTAVQYQMPVHVRDENGQWQDIDNTLSESGSEYATSNAKIKFAKKITGNETLFTLHDGNRKITMSLDGAKKKTTGTVTNTHTEFDESATKLQKMMTLDKLSSKIMYSDILDGTDLEYVVESLNIKENIIVKERKDSYSYSFTIKLNNLDAVLNDDGSVSIFDPDTKDTVYMIPAPVVYDAEYNYASSGDSYFTLTKSGNNTYSLTVTANPEWMNADERTYPVVIDPAICASANSTMTDTYVDSDNLNTVYYSYNFLAVGRGGSGQDFISYWKQNSLPTISENAYINSAKLELYCQDVRCHDSNYTSDIYIGAYKVTSDWTSGATWNTVSSGSKGAVSNLLDYATVNSSNKNEYISWDITALYNAWLDGGANHGIALKQIGSEDMDVLFTSENSGSNRPRMVVNYRDMKGIEPYWSFSSQSAGMAGVGSVNNATGNLVFQIPTVSTGDAFFNYTPTLVYSTAYPNNYLNINSNNDNIPYKYASVGCEMKISTSESIISRQFANEKGEKVTYYIWSDSDGTEHYFSSGEGGAYRDEDGLMLKLEHVVSANNTRASVLSSKYHITDANGNIRCFSCDPMNSNMNGGGTLEYIQDKYGNKLIFDNDSKGHVTSISLLPSGGNEETDKIEYLTFSYNSIYMVSEITNVVTQTKMVIYNGSTYNGTTDYGYGYGGPIRKILYQHKSGSTWQTDAETFYTYTNISGGLSGTTYRLSSAKDVTSGAEIRYTYDSKGRVATAQEYGNNKAGQKIGFTYGTGYTEVRTSGSDDIYGNTDDIINHYSFDREGRVISAYSTDVSRKTIYGASSGEYESENENAKNNLKSSSISGGSRVNHIMNGNFENLTATPNGTVTGVNNWILSSQNVRASMDVLGDRASYIQFDVKKNTTDSLTQYVSLYNGDYTISAKVKSHSCQNTTAKITVESLSNSSHKYEKVISLNSSAEGQSSDPSITFKADGGNYAYEKYKVSFVVIGGSNANENGEVGIDNVMLADGIGSSEYSSVQMGSFYSSSIDASGNITTDRCDVWAGIYGDTPSYDVEGNPFNTVLKIDGGLSSGELYSGTDGVSQDVQIISEAFYNYCTNLEFPIIPRQLMTPHTYIISGFAKGSEQVDNPGSAFGLSATVYYYDGSCESFDFSYDINVTDWQYLSGTFTTSVDKLIKYVKVECEYLCQPGVAYFDNISLSEAPGNSVAGYTYYPEGLVKSVVYPSSSEYYEYDKDNNMTLKATSDFNIYEYKYNNGVLTSSTTYDYNLQYSDNEANGDNKGENADIYLKWLGASAVSGETIAWLKTNGVYLDVIKTPKVKTEYSINSYGLNTRTVTYSAVSGSGENVVINPSEPRRLISSSTYITTVGSENFGKVSSTTDTNGNTKYYVYNDYGQLQYERNSVNEGLYYYYDSLGRMTDVRALYYDVYLNAYYGQSTEHLQYVYNGKNQLSQTSTESTEYSYTYDDFGNVVIIEAGEYILAEYTYAANNGKLSSMEYGNGTVVNYTYDTLDRIDQICYTDTNGNQKTYKYTYTTDGKIHTVEDSSSGVGYMYSYNSDGSMSGYIEYRLDSNENVIGIEYIYNEQSLIEQVNTSFTFAVSSGTATDLILSCYEYNDDQSLKQLEIDTAGSNFNTYKIAYSYDKFNRLSGKTATYGSLTYETDYIYKNLNSTRTSSQVSMYCTFINNIETSYSYTYDVNGNITQIRDDDDKVTQYRYDDQGQLIREDNPYFNKTYVYTYDNAGNRTSKKTYAYTTGTLGSVTSTDTYTYSDETWGDLLTGVNGSNITYDEIGNPSSNGAYHRYTWQNGRQLAQIFDTSHVYTYSYTYNSDGIRTSKTVNGQKHTYTLNGSQIVSEEWTSGSTTHTLVYLYDESGSPIGLQYRPSSMVKEIFYTYFFEKNLQGDITAVFKENGVKIGTYCYDAWGNVKTTVSSGITALEKSIVQSYNPFRYRGYYYDTESGLYYLHSRYYNPQWGRFLNADGDINANGDIIGYNLYVYCSNNPIMYVDPTGEKWYDVILNVVQFLMYIPIKTTEIAVASTIALCQGRFSDFKDDWNNGCYNPLNQDESVALKSKVFSFYRGEAVIRHSIPNLTSWQIFGTIYLNTDERDNDDGIAAIRHESGHGRQELFMAPGCYLFGVALPSAINCGFGRSNDIERYSKEERERMYYSKIWERTADWLGGVDRNNYDSFWNINNFLPW